MKDLDKLEGLGLSEEDDTFDAIYQEAKSLTDGASSDLSFEDVMKEFHAEAGQEKKEPAPQPSKDTQPSEEAKPSEDTQPVQTVPQRPEQTQSQQPKKMFGEDAIRAALAAKLAQEIKKKRELQTGQQKQETSENVFEQTRPIPPLNKTAATSNGDGKDTMSGGVFLGSTLNDSGYRDYLDQVNKSDAEFEQYLKNKRRETVSSTNKEAVERLFSDFAQEEKEEAAKERTGLLGRFFQKAKEEEAEVEEPESEYEDYSDKEEQDGEAPFIKDEYQSLTNTVGEMLRQLRSRFLTAAVCTALLLYITVASVLQLPLPDVFDSTVNIQVHMFVTILLYLGVMVSTHKELMNGMRAAIAIKAEPDSALAFAAAMAFIHAVCQIPSVLGDGPFVFFGPIAATALSISLYIKMRRVSCIYENLQTLKRIPEKISIERIADQKLIDKLMGKRPIEEQIEEIDTLMNAVQKPRTQQESEPECQKIMYEGKVDDTYDFEEMSFSIDESHYFSAYAVPLAVCYAIAGAIIMGILRKDVMLALHTFVLMAVTSAPLTLEMCYTVPYQHLAERFRKHDTVALGSTAIRRLYDCDGVVVEDSYIFEKGSICLHSMKFLGDVHIDEVFIDMASVLHDMKCAAASVFMNALQNNESLLRPVQGWENERGQGVAALMKGGRELFIGKKEYMQKNGFEIPEVFDHSGQDISGKSNVLYVGSEKRVYGVFELSYTAGKEVIELMDVLSSNGVTVFFKSCDVFLDHEFMKENFRVNVESFRTVEENAYMDMERLMDTKVQGTSGIYMKKNTMENLADVICECKRMQNLVKRNLFITAGAMLTAPLAAFMIVWSRGGVNSINPLALLAVPVLWIIPLVLNSHK